MLSPFASVYHRERILTTMRVAYLANVGTRDVQRQGKFLDKPRSEGAALGAYYEKLHSELSSPILSAGLRHVLGLAESIACVQLFASDQPAPPTTKEVFWEKDTLEFGKLLQRLLRDEFGMRLARIECAAMHCNPADYNRTLPFFAEKLRQLVPPETIDVVCVAPVGGADASNVALTINAIRCYRRKCQFIYVMPDGSVHHLNLHQELLGDYARGEALAHLRRHDYAAIREVLIQAQIGKPWHQHLCAYADRRACFDFARADAALQAALDCADGGEVMLQINHLRQTLKPFLVERKSPTSASTEDEWDNWLSLQRLLLGELYFNLSLKANCGEWVDFLGRVFRLHEAILRLIFEMETRHSSDGNDMKGYPDFKKCIDERSDIAGLGLEAKPTTFALGTIVNHWVREASCGPKYGKALKIHELIGKLSALRNKSIIAHGYQPVSEEDICEALNGETPLSILHRVRSVLESLSVDLVEEKNPYAAAKSLLNAMLT
jgi:hypothetical protein